MTSRNETLFPAPEDIPGGVNSPVRAFRAVGGTPRFFKAREALCVGRPTATRYIDYSGSWGPPRPRSRGPGGGQGRDGHREERPFVRRAPTENGNRDGRAAREGRAGHGLVRLVSSGTEATMTALRLARRAYRSAGRSSSSKAATRARRQPARQGGLGRAHARQPFVRGRAAGVAGHTVVLSFNDTQQLADTSCARRRDRRRDRRTDRRQP